jgi:hypothetical protein
VLSIQELYHTPNPFGFSYFLNTVLCFCPGLDCDPPIYAAPVAKMIGICHHTKLYWLRWDLTKFLLGLALNRDPPDLCLPSSWDCRGTLSCLASLKCFWSRESSKNVTHFKANDQNYSLEKYIYRINNFFDNQFHTFSIFLPLACSQAFWEHE